MNDNPLSNPRYKSPGLWEKLLEALLGYERPFQCVQIEVTSHCANRCDYCPRAFYKNSWKSRHINPETFAGLWPLLRRTDRAHLQGWGEPFAHPRFFDLAAFAKKAGANVSTTSSGLIMDDALAEKITRSGMDIVAFSLAGTDEESNSIRRGISFERVCESAAILKRKIREIGRGPEIHIAYIMLADRMEAALKLPRIMAKIDADLAVISTLDYISHPSHEKWAILPRDKAAIEKARGILEKISRKAEADGRFIHFALPAENVVHENGCRENALKTLYIDADGFLSPCVYLNPPFAAQKARRKVFGDANAVDPLVLWNGEEWKNFRSLLRDRNPDPVCRSCPKRDES